jgi:hypothetical protein
VSATVTGMMLIAVLSSFEFLGPFAGWKLAGQLTLGRAFESLPLCVL